MKVFLPISTGRNHVVKVWFCSCEEEAVTLIRHNIWSASPKCPTVGVDMELMCQLRAFKLEAKVATKAFFESMKFYHKIGKHKVRSQSINLQIILQELVLVLCARYH